MSSTPFNYEIHFPSYEIHFPSVKSYLVIFSWHIVSATFYILFLVSWAGKSLIVAFINNDPAEGLISFHYTRPIFFLIMVFGYTLAGILQDYSIH
jgi:hypothetical protein